MGHTQEFWGLCLMNVFIDPFGSKTSSESQGLQDFLSPSQVAFVLSEFQGNKQPVAYFSYHLPIHPSRFMVRNWLI